MHEANQRNKLNKQLLCMRLIEKIQKRLLYVKLMNRTRKAYGYEYFIRKFHSAKYSKIVNANSASSL